MKKLILIFTVSFIFLNLNSFSQVIKKWEGYKLEYPVFDSTTVVNLSTNFLSWQNNDSLQLTIKIFEGVYFNSCKDVVEQMIYDQKLLNTNLKAVSQKEFVGGNGYNCYYYKGTALQNNKKVAFNIYGFYDPYEFKNMSACVISSKSNILENFYYLKFIELSDKYLKSIQKIN